MTEYVILHATNEAGTIFAIDGEATASSDQAAIRKHRLSSNTDDDTVWAAIPKRSWRPVRVELQVKETVKVTRL